MPTVQNRSALDAVQAVHGLLNTGYTEVVDADLSGYFDSIPHAELMQCVARRVSDKAVLHLHQAVAGDAGRRAKMPAGMCIRTTRNKDEGRGSAARGTDLTLVVQSVHAAIRAGLENAGTRADGFRLASSTMPMTS